MIIVAAAYRCRRASCWGTGCIFFLFRCHGRKIGRRKNTDAGDLNPGPERLYPKALTTALPSSDTSSRRVVVSSAATEMTTMYDV